MAKNVSSAVPAEIAQFSQQAGDWWNPEGPFKPLHQLNPVRLGYVRNQICQHFGREANKKLALKGLQLLDVGCGGGLLSEPLARLGAQVTGIDASKEGILIARQHAEDQDLDIDYLSTTSEALALGKKRFDVIVAFEILEHVADAEAFVSSLVQLLKPDGLLLLSTLNRTPQSFALGIVAAEYILGWVPRGTHQWQKFIKPSELIKHLTACGLRTTDLMGMIYNPLLGAFELKAQALSVNYFVTATR